MDRIILEAQEGKVYTNGLDYGYTVYLATGETAEGWYEIPEEEYLAMFEVEEVNEDVLS